MVLRDPLVVDFALQSGGAQGAFTWLDRLLREPWLKIDGISGTSAGAITPPYSPTVMPKAVPRARAALETFYSISTFGGTRWPSLVPGAAEESLLNVEVYGAMSALGQKLTFNRSRPMSLRVGSRALT